jgi:hypothetical protein
VKVSKRVGERDGVINYLAAGNDVCEMALVSNAPRSVTVGAASNATESIRIDGAAFRTLMDKVPVLARDVEGIFCERLSRNERVVHSRDAGNVLEFLLRQGVGEGTDVLLIDESLGVRCDNCETACASTHHGVSRLKCDAGPSCASLHVPTSCRHCEHPYCMTDCPRRCDTPRDQW